MWFKRIIRWMWAIFGRLLLYGIAIIVILNLFVKFQMEQRGRQWGRGGNRHWRQDREPSQRRAPRIRVEYDQSLRDQIDQYPLSICVVSGQALDDQGDPVDYDHNGLVVRLCCEDCVREFRTDPSYYTKALLEASLTRQ